MSIYSYIHILYKYSQKLNKEKNNMTTTNLVKCNCDRCSCEISVENAIKKEDGYYCCEACANGHSNDQSCKMSDCDCG